MSVTTETCEQVVPDGLANTLANAMGKDDTGSGTAAGSAGSVGWTLPVSGKTGTTEAHRSSGFLGFTSALRRRQLHLRRLDFAVGPVLLPAAPVRVGQPLRR